MLAKLHRIYWYAFKLLIIANLALSLYLVITLTWTIQISTLSTFFLLFVLKLTGYGVSASIELLFYAKKRAYMFKNLRFGYRQLFAYLITLDVLFLIIILFLCGMAKSFL